MLQASCDQHFGVALAKTVEIVRPVSEVSADVLIDIVDVRLDHFAKPLPSDIVQDGLVKRTSSFG
jgi:hypothetical protein